MTRKIKYLVIRDSSTPVFLGIPSNLAKTDTSIKSHEVVSIKRKTATKKILKHERLRMIGKSMKRTASNTVGRTPEMIPTTTEGNLQIQANQETLIHREETFETKPTKATVWNMTV